MSLVLSGTGQVYAFMGLAVAFGLGLFLLTRGESVDALEAESYEPDPAPARSEAAPGRPDPGPSRLEPVPSRPDPVTAEPDRRRPGAEPPPV